MYVVTVETKKQLDDAFRVRTEVFFEEQNVPMEEEIDEFEDQAIHFVVYDQNETAIGAGRLRFIDGFGKIERICIVKTSRGTGVGRLLMDKIEEAAQQKGASKTKLNAQIQAETFYKKLGYETVSDQFMDAGIPHVTMIKTLLS
ncbi:GNAT family N-acetyltransferase [Halalkalibacter alkalisediminis]|uniref:GNAT family N-acetyltransferase n=1 Tax=Halalkalibacter alkalisediminis TaxID=935616 RepID=A0ABV6NBG2_9BACI|nr:GNAT family N-acetyltransferase [Halalkalibacter alkalisediminis]